MTEEERAIGMAAWLMREKNMSLYKAVNAAAKRWNIDRDVVHSGLSARSGRSQRGKPNPAMKLQSLMDHEADVFALHCRQLRHYAERIGLSSNQINRLMRISKQVERKTISRRDATWVKELYSKHRFWSESLLSD